MLYVHTSDPHTRLTNPVFVHWTVVLKLDHTNVAKINFKCEKFIKPLITVWFKWTRSKIVLLHKHRSVVGALGTTETGLWLLNTIQSKVVANKLAYSAKVLIEVKWPAVTSLSWLAQQVVDTLSLLPLWYNTTQQEQLLMIDALEQTQKDTGKGLACTQVQTWIQVVINSIFRQRYQGHIPLAIKQIIMEDANCFEICHQKRWELQSFKYD